jgi:hypothetical protein
MRCTTSGPSLQSPDKRGYGGIRMSGVTPKHEVLPGAHDRRRRGDSSSPKAFRKKNKTEKRSTRKSEGSKGKTEADSGEASKIKAILATTTKLTSLPKASSIVETRPKTAIS